jgi:hypothetical protein
MEEFDDIQKELEGIAPMLSKLPRTNAFRVDEAYFDTLPTIVMERVHATKKRNWFNLSWLLQPRWAATMAVCIIAVIFGSFLLFHNINTDKAMPVAEVQKLLIEPVNKESILDNVDADALEDALASNDLPKVTPTHKKELKLKNAADKKVLENYILDNVDESALIEDL